MLQGIHWLGHDTFRIDGSSIVYIDPWKLPADAPDADIILVTHGHFDHFSPPDIAMISTEATTVLGPAAVTALLRGGAIVTMVTDETVTVGDVTITAVAAYNTDKFRAPGEPFHPPATGVGYVVEMDGRRIYHAGDTDVVPEMSAVQCDVALLPVGGTFTMTADEAAHACDLLTAAAVIPMHYGDIVGSVDDAERLQEICSIPVTILPAEGER